jgi:hypothetical protein
MRPHHLLLATVGGTGEKLAGGIDHWRPGPVSFNVRLEIRAFIPAKIVPRAEDSPNQIAH